MHVFFSTTPASAQSAVDTPHFGKSHRATQAADANGIGEGKGGNRISLDTAAMQRSTGLLPTRESNPNTMPQGAARYIQTVVTVEPGARFDFGTWRAEAAIPVVVHIAALSRPLTPQVPIPSVGPEAMIGNPTFLGFWKVPEAPLSLGGGVALPLGGDYIEPQDLRREIESAQTLAAAAHAGWSVWRYRVDSTGAFAIARVSTSTGDHAFELAGELAGGVLAGRDVEPVFQLGGTGSVAVGITRLGGHLRHVWLPGSDRGESYLVSFEPWVSIEIAPLTFVAGQLFRLDEAARPPDAVDSLWRPRFAARFDW